MLDEAITLTWVHLLQISGSMCQPGHLKVILMAFQLGN